MTLKEILAQTTLKDLENLDLLDLPFYSRGNHQVLSFFRDNGILDNTSIERALKRAVINRGEKDYTYVIHKEIRPDRVTMPECLAYAIQHKYLSPNQIAGIPFGNGETPETFCRTYEKKNLLASLREELLNPKPLPDLYIGRDDCC